MTVNKTLSDRQKLTLTVMHKHCPETTALGEIIPRNTNRQGSGRGMGDRTGWGSGETNYRPLS